MIRKPKRAPWVLVVVIMFVGLSFVPSASAVEPEPQPLFSIVMEPKGETRFGTEKVWAHVTYNGTEPINGLGGEADDQRYENEYVVPTDMDYEGVIVTGQTVTLRFNNPGLFIAPYILRFFPNRDYEGEGFETSYVVSSSHVAPRHPPQAFIKAGDKRLTVVLRTKQADATTYKVICKTFGPKRRVVKTKLVDGDSKGRITCRRNPVAKVHVVVVKYGNAQFSGLKLKRRIRG